MADIILYETFLFYQARSREEQTKRREAAETLQKINRLLGFETDELHKED